jgi:hypothetical protein
MATPEEIMNAIRRKGPEFMIGMDIPRIWATGAQVFVDQETSTLVLREQAILQGADEETEVLVRNVASIIIPTEILKEMHEIIARELGKLDAAEAE